MSNQKKAASESSQQFINQTDKIFTSKNSSENPSSQNQKWQKIIEQDQKQDEQSPFILKQESFQSQNKLQEYERQKLMMQQAAKKGRQFLINKNYQQASKQLSKALMAFEFIAKNHGQTIGKEQIKQLMISIILPAYNNLSLCYLKLKNYEVVVSFTNQVLGQDSGNVKARYRRGLAYTELKRTDEAIKDFQFVKKLDEELKSDCNQRIRHCKVIETQQRKKRKLVAQKFLSGYQSENIKPNGPKSVDPKESLIQQVQQDLPNKTSIIEWIKEKCQQLTRFLPKMTSKKQKQQKQP